VALASNRGAALVDFQSNAEHALIERVHAAKSAGIDAIVLNPGGFTHTSVALRDALLGVGCRSTKCTCRTPTLANRSGTTRISPTRPPA
jgi:3-dehydroquinate dehydratase